MDKREQTIRAWFEMWLQGSDAGVEELFDPDEVYIESWGPEYHGLPKIRHWFREWNTRGVVLRWEVRQFFHRGDQTVAEWAFECRMDGGKADAFEGISLIRWTAGGKICFLQEFGCNQDRYDPYEKGPEPQFRDEQIMWF